MISAFRSLTLIGFLSLSATSLFAQHEHVDLELGYDNLSTPGSLILHGGDYTSDGIRLFESGMEELDPFDPGNFSSDAPGFATNAAEGILVNPGDQIWIRALDAATNSAFGVGYVNFYNPLTDSLEATGRIGLYDNSTATADLILNGMSVESGLLSQFIDIGDTTTPGGIHDHVIFDLLDDSSAPLGAYGILFELQSDFATADGIMDLTSEKFWLVWNHGMDEGDFDTFALPKFGAISAVPEPSAALLLGIAGLGSVLMRRRKD
ncbi:MAG: PEP-CTERM sorting domain-containing protein [Pirellulaceae bacterium]